jgi:hypothetical protein
MAKKRASQNGNSSRVFGQGKAVENVSRLPECPRVHPRPADTFIANARHARYAGRRGWTIALQIREVGSGAATSEKLGRSRWRQRDVVKSTWCWCGDWTAGADRQGTCSLRFNNSIISVWVRLADGSLGFDDSGRACHGGIAGCLC